MYPFIISYIGAKVYRHCAKFKKIYISQLAEDVKELGGQGNAKAWLEKFSDLGLTYRSDGFYVFEEKNLKGITQLHAKYKDALRFI